MSQKSSALERFLDRIIETYTATPRDDPETVGYSLRPTKAERKMWDRERGSDSTDEEYRDHGLDNLAQPFV